MPENPLSDEQALAQFLEGELARVEVLVTLWRTHLRDGMEEEAEVARCEATGRLAAIEESITYLTARDKVRLEGKVSEIDKTLAA